MTHHESTGRRTTAGLLPAEAPAALAAITSRLVGNPDNAAVLRLITEVGTGLLGARGTGVLLKDPRGEPAVVATSDETTQFLELLQTDLRQGPCVDCITTAAVVAAPDLTRKLDRWPDFAAAALDAGYQAVVAVPLRLDGEAVGGFNLLFAAPTELEPWQSALAQVVSDLAVLALVQETGPRRSDRLFEATLTSLNDRVQHSQAVGVVAGTLGTDPDTARALVNGYATRHDRPLREVTRALIDHTLDPAALAT
ncbi:MULTISPECIES: GAF domain-containing protein [Amycolatopsis]|uniref:GAF and ANTAR domain-containing protein n=1 Tax=Amycolatopsis dendrobii TaxID=2760662 RepID=A0A7W3ZES6_9PSEU|nr:MULTISPECIES: GAF domain-containing protein [Amycolatopsis]MBB1158353.1 GAF and ANTAR domain-containing protein [Amycolatopsis dendrobii]UKD56855.1 GAF domain-containing protein [Amycolatopsis sp. FU40]